MHDSINNNLELFQERFLAACFNADIKPADVLTIAVSKKKDISITDLEAREHVYGMPYSEWKEKYQK